jgi:DNA polymerase-3 subunit delta
LAGRYGRIKRPRKERVLLYILTGPDDFSRSEALSEIKKGLGDPTLLATNTTVLQGGQLALDELRNACETVPFLSEKRLVVVEGLLERFEPKGRSGRKRNAAKADSQKAEHKPWADFLKGIPESTVLVLLDGKLDNRNPLYRELGAGATVKPFPLLNKAGLRQWLERRVRAEGGSGISTQAAELLAKLVGSNLWSMQHEIKKLLLFTQGRTIGEEDVRKLVASTQQTSVFAMIDAILESKVATAEQSLQQLLAGGAAPAYLMVMLTRQIRMIARVKELKAQRKSEAEIQNRLGIASEYAFRKTLEQASRFPAARIRETYRRLLETDLAIKTGRCDGELALDILAAELCSRALR